MATNEALRASTVGLSVGNHLLARFLQKLSSFLGLQLVGKFLGLII